MTPIKTLIKMPVKALIAAMLYAALLTSANPLTAQNLDPAALTAARTGEMKKLAIHKIAKPASIAAFEAADGTPLTLADFKGKIVVLNFWATWCAPCREEMPSLDTLQTTLGGDDFAVVAVATGRNPLPAIKKFYQLAEVKNLTIYRDPKQGLARDLGVFGLPTTVILGPDGQEIARLRGDADWASEDAIAILSLIKGSDGGS